MAKKVTLDILDIEESSVSIQEQPPEVKMEGVKPPVRWFVSRWFRLACAAMVTLSCVAGLLYWWMPPPKNVPPAPGVKVADPGLVQFNKNIEFVNDFLIPLKDDKGNQRVLMFDLGFELDTGQASLFREKIVSVRNSIYQTISKTTASVPLGPGGMKFLRGEIIADLGNVLDKGVIKAVYFKSFIVL
jgi:flagellar basal body-associated protein FliL